MQDPVTAPVKEPRDDMNKTCSIDYEREYYRLTDENRELRAKVTVLENAIICDFVKRAESENVSHT